MTKTQKYIALFFAGIFLLSLTCFREELFVQNNLGIWLYRLCSMGSILIVAGAAGRLLGKKTMWSFLIFVFIAESCFALLFQNVINGKELPTSLQHFLGYIYLFHCRDYIVYDNDRGRYNDELFYTLKPGDFNYSNMEFSTEYHVNSMGFRDDENSLNFPEIIFLGDSYTMGWGVNQEENYVSLLEKKLNKKTLNLGIASYGTAREYRAFERIKHDSCKLVILQFCPNDTTENRAFVKNNYQLNISPKDVFEKEVRWNKIYQLYFPLKYIHSSINYLFKKLTPTFNDDKKAPSTITEGISEKALSDFFLIIEKIKESFSGKILIFNLGMNITTPDVNDQFENWLIKNPIPRVYVFPSTNYLSKEDYLPLDTHLKKSGNEKLAKGLVEFILEKSLIK